MTFLTVFVFLRLLAPNGCMGISGKHIVSQLKVVSDILDDSTELENTERKDITSILQNLLRKVSDDSLNTNALPEELSTTREFLKSNDRDRTSLNTKILMSAFREEKVRMKREQKITSYRLDALESKASHTSSRETFEMLIQNQGACMKELKLVTEQLGHQINAIVQLQEGHDKLHSNISALGHTIQSMSEHMEYLYNNSRDNEVVDTFSNDASDKSSQKPLSCRDIKEKKSGTYVVYPNFQRSGVNVYCDMEREGGGWIVFQRRKDGSLDFFRGWDEYKNGFGDVNWELWLGNDNLHGFTNERPSELRIDLIDKDGNQGFAKYNSFKVSSEENNYKLLINGYSGNVGDSLKYHSKMMFTTKDRDNDEQRNNCADERTGAWWYKSCSYSNLNGNYFGSGWHVLQWYKWHNAHTPMTFSEMKLRWKY